MIETEIRYRRLGYVILNVSDLAVSKPFYRDVVGLNLVAETESQAYFGIADDRPSVVLTPGVPGVKRVGWEMNSDEDLSLLANRFEQLGVPVEPSPAKDHAALGIARGICVDQPHCHAKFEFYVADHDRPYRPSLTLPVIQRLGHVVLAAPDFDGFEAWMIEVCGFAVSDRVAGRTSLMRCPPNPYHHSFGVGHSEVPKFHHLNFMVGSLDDVGRAFNLLKSKGVRIVFGPGRHPTSNSVFLYFHDPDGLTLEFSHGMELFPEGRARPYRDMPNRLESLDTWGGRPAEGYASIGVIEGTVA